MNPTSESLRAAGFIYVNDRWEKPKSSPAVKGEPETVVLLSKPASSEGALHEEIMEWCDTQHPRVKYIHSRMDKHSTIAVGAQDFTLFLPRGETLCIECKSKGKKLAPDQRDWHKEMEMVGHKVNTIWSFEEFLALLNK